MEKNTFHFKQNAGFAPIILMLVAGVILVAIAIYGFRDMKNFLPGSGNKTSTQSAVFNPAKNKPLTEKQKRLIRNKETVKKELNLNDGQFDALVRMSTEED